MSRLFAFVLGVLFAVSCSQDGPTQTAPLAEATALGEAVVINGAEYRLAAAKPTATQKDYSLTITIPMYTDDDGSLYLSETITIGDIVYTSNCEALTQGADDVGNTMETATELTVPTPTAADKGEFWNSPTYTLTPGDVDYFKLRVTQFLDIGVLSGPDGNTTDTVGKLMTSSGRVIFENDNAEGVEPNFTVWAIGISPGTLYLEVRGATPSTQGDYSLLVGTWLTASGKPVASSARQLELIGQ